MKTLKGSNFNRADITQRTRLSERLSSVHVGFRLMVRRKRRRRMKMVHFGGSIYNSEFRMNSKNLASEEYYSEGVGLRLIINYETHI